MIFANCNERLQYEKGRPGITRTEISDNKFSSATDESYHSLFEQVTDIIIVRDLKGNYLDFVSCLIKLFVK